MYWHKSLLPLLIAGCFSLCAVGGEAENSQAEGGRFPQPPSIGELVWVVPDEYSPPSEPLPPPMAADKAAAETLWQQAVQAAERGQAAQAWRLATEAVVRDPGHAVARRALGYQRHDDRWLTPYQQRMAEQGIVWDAKFGWIRQEDVPRYQRGEERYRGRWLSAEQAAERHASIATGWRIRTDHFLVTTNHSLERGAQLASQLEQLYQVWQQLLGDCGTSAAELDRRFQEGYVPAPLRQPHRVIYHRSHGEYAKSLLHRQPRIAETVGIYFAYEREAHFCDHPQANVTATLYHEGVHQLLQESPGARRDAGERAYFWATEAIALWFESLRQHDHPLAGRYFTIGEADAGRLPAARVRLLEHGYRVPLAELVPLGQQQLQQREDLPPLYSQMAGLATYFMADQELRPHFVEYLRRIYVGQAEGGTLAELTGRSYAMLDQQYRAFLQQLPP